MNETNLTTFEKFCGSALWEDTQGKNESEIITRCFQYTVCVWVPCFFIYICFPFYIIAYRKPVQNPILYNWLNISRLVLCSLLCILFLGDLGKTVYRLWSGLDIPLAIILAPGFELLAMLMALILIQLCRVRGVVSSCVLFIYWLLQCAAALIFLCKIVSDYVKPENEYVPASRMARDTHRLAQCVMFFGLCAAELVLAQIVEGVAYCSPELDKDSSEQKPCPQHGSSPLSIMTFWWFTGMAVKGYRKPLEKNDMWLLNEEDTSRHLNAVFQTHWEKQSKCSSASHSTKHQAAIDGEVDEQEVQLQPLNSPDQPSVAVVGGSHSGTKHSSLVKTLVSQFWVEFLVTAFHKFMHDIFMFVNPQILSLLLVYIKQDDQPVSIGVVYAILMLVVSSIESIFLQQYFHHSFRMGMNLRTCIIGAVYRKALKLTSAARQSSTIGEIVNLMSVDAQRFVDLMVHLHMIWSAPFQITVCMFFLWRILGPSVLAGFGVLVLMLPVNACLARKTRELQSAQMKHMDVRVKQTHEMLNGIKVIKLYAWEKSFMDRIQGVRNKELGIMRKASYLNAFSSFMWMCVPFMVSLVTFSVYVLSSPENVLTAEKTFVALALFSILRFPISVFPMLVGTLVQVSVSRKRLQAFLVLSEVNPDDITRDSTGKSAISVENGSFSWEEKAEPTLHDLNLNIAPGSLVAVVGTVGSGKSALLSAILGEMFKKQGSVTVKGSVALVTQQAWIQNATLKSNVLFGQEMKENLYHRVIDACQLEPDIKILPGGDMTEIGEKGINLSGGQKQRVSLARAVYANADTYLLDDPLSAVDSHVGKHLFDKVIGPEGMLKRKTRILVTHGIRYLPHVDQIIVLVGGRVTEVGTFRQLLDNNGAFAEFLKIYIQELGDEAKEELDELTTETEDNTVVAHLRQISISQSTEKLNKRKFSMSSETSEGLRSRRGTLTSSAKENGDRKSSIAAPSKDKSKNLVPSKLMTVEKAESGTVKLTTFTSYIKAIGIAFTIMTIIFIMLADAFSVVANMWLADWSNDAAKNESWTEEGEGNTTQLSSHVHMRLGVYAALGLAQGLTVLLASFSLVRGCISASETTHTTLLDKCLHYPMNFFDTTPTGRLINRFSKDVDVLDAHLPRNVQWWLRCATAILSMLVVISMSTPIFLLPASVVAVLYFFVQRFYVATSRQLIRLESVGRSPIYSHFGETVQGIMTIRAYGRQKEFTLESEARVDGSQMFNFPNIIANRWLAIRLEFVGNLIIFLAALLAVMGRSHLSAGTVGLSITYALMVTQTLNWVVRITSELEGNLVALERIREYCELDTEAPWEIPEEKPEVEWPGQGLVQFKSYSTRYRTGLDLVLNDISCTINPGEKVGIVGRTGAGKSSLTLALFRVLEPSGGYISIDDVNIMKIGLHDLRSQLTIIPQDPVLFSGTIRMNLDPFDKYTDDQVWKSLEQAHLKDFVASQAKGLQYECTEGGDNLSVGQRQLVCLARALLRHTKVLILDEATASVDMETDDLIQATIRSEFKDCTVVTIAHRLNTIMDYNRVMVLSSGKIVEYDSPQTLISRKDSIFCGMARDAGIVKQD